MKPYSFLMESVLPCKKLDHPHPFKLGDKVRVKKNIRCRFRGCEGTVIKVVPHEEYDYDVVTVHLVLPASMAEDPIMRDCSIDGKYRQLLTFNDGAFEKI